MPGSRRERGAFGEICAADPVSLSHLVSAARFQLPDLRFAETSQIGGFLFFNTREKIGEAGRALGSVRHVHPIIRRRGWSIMSI